MHIQVMSKNCVKVMLRLNNNQRKSIGTPAGKAATENHYDSSMAGLKKSK